MQLPVAAEQKVLYFTYALRDGLRQIQRNHCHRYEKTHRESTMVPPQACVQSPAQQAPEVSTLNPGHIQVLPCMYYRLWVAAQ